MRRCIIPRNKKKYEPFVRAGWIDDTWDYSSEQKAEIVAALERGEEGRSFLPAIIRDVQEHRLWLQLEGEEPRAGEVRRQLKALETGIDRVLRELPLHDPTEELIEMHTHVDITGLLNDLKPKLTGLWMSVLTAQRDFKGRGRPKETANRILVGRLALIWEKAHGALPTRRLKDGKEAGPFREFVHVCFSPFNRSGAGLDDVIRGTIKNLKRSRT